MNNQTSQELKLKIQFRKPILVTVTYKKKLTERGLSGQGMLTIPDVRHGTKNLSNMTSSNIFKRTPRFIKKEWKEETIIRTVTETFYKMLFLSQKDNLVVPVTHTIWDFSNFRDFSLEILTSQYLSI